MDKKTVLELASAFAFLDAANIGDDSHAIWSAEDFYTDVINDIMVEQIGLQGISEDVAKAQAFAKQMFETGVSDFDPSWVEEQFGLGDHVDRHGLELNGLEEVASQTRSLPNEVSDVIWYDVFDDEVHISEVFGNDYIEYEDGCYQICTTQKPMTAQEISDAVAGCIKAYAEIDPDSAIVRDVRAAQEKKAQKAPGDIAADIEKSLAKADSPEDKRVERGGMTL